MKMELTDSMKTEQDEDLCKKKGVGEKGKR